MEEVKDDSRIDGRNLIRYTSSLLKMSTGCHLGQASLSNPETKTAVPHSMGPEEPLLTSGGGPVQGSVQTEDHLGVLCD